MKKEIAIMKKILIVFLTFCIAFCFAACGASGGEGSGDSTSEPDTTVAETTEKEVFDEVLLTENEYLTMKLIDVDPAGEEGYTLKVNIENKSATDYCYSIEECSVNGVAVDVFFFSEVTAGKKTIESVVLSDELLKKNGITEYTDIEMILTVQEDILDDVIYTQTLHYYPLGQEKATVYERNVQTDTLLVDNEYVTITAVGVNHDEEWECQSLVFYITNKTDGTLSLDGETGSVNDIMCDPLYYESIPAGKSKFSSVDWSDYDLEEKCIDKIEKLEVELAGYGETDYEEVVGGLIGDILSGDVELDDLTEADDGALFKLTITYAP